MTIRCATCSAAAHWRIAAEAIDDDLINIGWIKQGAEWLCDACSYCVRMGIAPGDTAALVELVAAMPLFGSRIYFVGAIESTP